MLTSTFSLLFWSLLFYFIPTMIMFVHWSAAVRITKRPDIIFNLYPVDFFTTLLALLWIPLFALATYVFISMMTDPIPFSIDWIGLLLLALIVKFYATAINTIMAAKITASELGIDVFSAMTEKEVSEHGNKPRGGFRHLLMRATYLLMYKHQ
jgi:hypothetical protein